MALKIFTIYLKGQIILTTTFISHRGKEQKQLKSKSMLDEISTMIQQNLQYIIMLAQKIPSQLNYSQIVPKGFPSMYKQWTLDPMSSNKQWANNDIVRFNFMNLGKGVFDPYRSYIQITVSTDINSMPVGLLQIDNSAQSFFQQTVLYSKTRQLQRITQYGVLAAYLNDIGLNQIISQCREAQGLGFGSFDTMVQPRSQNTNQGVLRRQNSSSDGSMSFSTGNIFPTIGNGYPQTIQYSWNNSIYNCSRQAKAHVSNSNPIMSWNDWNGGQIHTNSSGVSACILENGWANNIRGQYYNNFIHPKFPQATWSIPNYQLQVSSSTNGGVYPFKYANNKPYLTGVRTKLDQRLYFDGGVIDYSSNVINCSNYGFTSLFTPFFTRGCFQPFISATVPQLSIMNGKISQTKVPLYRRKFKIPLLSGVIGVLIDPSQFILIPLASIQDLYLEITLDPYAMFTSGYSDYCQLDDIGMSIMQKRNYQIQRIQYKLQTYVFMDNQIQKYIEASLIKQITVTSFFWSMSNQYQIPGGTPVNNTYIVGCNSTHLCEMVCLFVSNDYQTYSFARKHYRLSNCIRKFWSKLAVDYWPPQPYKGNGGNVMSNNIDDDNSIFVDNIYWSAGYMFEKNALPRINAYNFALNERPYNVTNKQVQYQPSMYQNQHYSFNANSINSDTAMGMPWIHQNRAVGKAAYVITYTPFSQNDHFLQGINVSKISNFEAIFEQDGSNTYPRDQTLYIFTKTCVIVQYTAEGIKTYGR